MCLLRVLSLWFIGAQGKLLLEHLHSMSLYSVCTLCEHMMAPLVE